MAVPAFWNTPYSYTEVAGVTDINGLIAAVHAALTAPALGWTDESGVGTGPWRTPTRADGVFFRVSLTRTSATRVTYQMYDQAGVNVMGTLNCCMDIDAGGTMMHIYAGTLHLAITSARAVHESNFFAVLDQTPEPINVPNALYIAYVGPRTSDGVLRNYGWNFSCRRDPGATAYNTGKQSAVQRMNGGGYRRRTIGLTALFAPAEYCDSGITPPTWLGRIPQSIVVDDAIFPIGSEITVPIDAGTNAVFKVLGCGVFSQQRIAFRKS